MNRSSPSGKSRLAAGLVLGAVGLVTALSTPVLHAQISPEGERSVAQQLKGNEYKRGETPTGHDYGIIKKGDPPKNEAARKKLDKPHKKHDMKEGAKPDAQPGTGAMVDRDKRESHEGSGPDPFGRY